MRKHSYLKRLPREWYLGRAAVFWSMTIADRVTGWLDREIHLWFRETMMHSMHRYSLICPGYVLMPDHFHFVWLGVAEESDQIKAAGMFRKGFNGVLRLRGVELQKQGHEHVLREEEREREALQATLHYVWENPVRAGLVENAGEWKFSGSLACGYPDLNWRSSGFWDRFWKIHAIEAGEV